MELRQSLLSFFILGITQNSVFFPQKVWIPIIHVGSSTIQLCSQGEMFHAPLVTMFMQNLATMGPMKGPLSVRWQQYIHLGSPHFFNCLTEDLLALSSLYQVINCLYMIQKSLNVMEWVKLNLNQFIKKIGNLDYLVIRSSSSNCFVRTFNSKNTKWSRGHIKHK